ncbi:MAG: efflux RND transporter periplasmic adaptor subunit [Bryobacteraceae bacterium]|nr:efflux RND transporter periplasmic adaptor subunit [Bryobacteraceae bacterium]
MKARALALIPIGLAAAALVGVGGFKYYRDALGANPDNGTPGIPMTTVKRGDVTFTITARGELQGGNSEMLVAPMTGGREMAITFLKGSGELVSPGDLVVEFDSTEQAYELREAESDLAEAEQEVIRARAESAAKDEETRYALLGAEAQVRLAELEARKNPLLAAITARQNMLDVEAARDKLKQLRQDLANRAATNEAAIAIQVAAQNKAKVRAETARRNIEALTLRAKSKGYVAVQQNTNSNWFYGGMQLPILQVGDTVNAGMAVAMIPDLDHWEVSAQIGELDRGHLEIGQTVEIAVIATPDKRYSGKIKDIGGTTGPPWHRQFECKMSFDNPSPELRQGMTATVVAKTGVLKDVLWTPSQALFESDGRAFVYVRTSSGLQPRDVKLVRRSESQAVLEGVAENEQVALASPEQGTAKKKNGRGVLEALPGS